MSNEDQQVLALIKEHWSSVHLPLKIKNQNQVQGRLYNDLVVFMKKAKEEISQMKDLPATENYMNHLREKMREEFRVLRNDLKKYKEQGVPTDPYGYQKLSVYEEELKKVCWDYKIVKTADWIKELRERVRGNEGLVPEPSLWQKCLTQGLAFMHSLVNEVKVFNEQVVNIMPDWASNLKEGVRWQDEKKAKESQLKQLNQLAQLMIERYDLAGIEFENTDLLKNIKHLKKIDAFAKEISEKLNMKPSCLGLFGTLTLKIGKENWQYSGMFTPSSNTLEINSFSGSGISTFLHEWTHALDYQIGQQVKLNTFASESLQPVFMDNSPVQKAYGILKKMMYQIQHHSPRQHEEALLGLQKEGSEEFWSKKLGIAYYTMAEEQKKQLSSRAFLNILNNLCVLDNNGSFGQPSSNSQVSKAYLDQQVKQWVDKLRGFTDQQKKMLSQALEPDNCVHVLPDIKDYFEDFKNKMFENSSVYWYQCRASQVIFNGQANVAKKLLKLVGRYEEETGKTKTI